MKLVEPPIMSKPFSHLKEAISTIADYKIGDTTIDPTQEARSWIDAAIKGFEQGEGFKDIPEAQKEKIDDDELILKLKDILINEKFNEVDGIKNLVLSSGSNQAIKYLSLIFNRWGSFLLNTEIFLDNEHAEEVFQESINIFIKSIELNPEGYDGYNNLGLALSSYASTQNNENAEKFYGESFKKFARAIKIKPDLHAAYNNYGVALLECSRILNVDKQKESIKKSIDFLKKAYELENEFSPYNLSCAYSLIGNKDESLKWLETDLNSDNPQKRYHILNDSDLDNIKNTKEFKALLDKYLPE